MSPRIKKAFAEIYRAVGHLSDQDVLAGPGREFEQHFQRLHPLAATEVNDEQAFEMMADPEFKARIRRIAQLKTIYGLRLEIERARAIIAAPDPWRAVKAFPFYPNYVRLADMETAGGNLHAGDRVVFIGSGHLPLSLICMARQYGIQGVGIERETEYAELSQKLLGVLGLERKIRIIHGDHHYLPLEPPLSLVMVGADARPRKVVLDYLAKTIEPGEKLSYRIYEKGFRRFLDAQEPFALPDGFKEIGRVRPEPPVNNTAVFVIRR